METGEEGPCVGFVFDSRLSRPSPEKSGYQTLAFHRISRFSPVHSPSAFCPQRHRRSHGKSAQKGAFCRRQTLAPAILDRSQRVD